MADYLSAREGLLELSLIVFGVWAIVAFLGGKAGYRMGAKRAAAEIADFFLHEITSSNNDLKSIPALLARRSMLTDGSLIPILSKSDSLGIPKSAAK
jgi:hypothetical protein